MNKKKIMSLIMALVMLVGVFSPLTAFADNTSEPAKPGATHNTKVRIHKVLMDEKELNKKVGEKDVWPKDHDGSAIENIQNYFGNNAKLIDGVAFRVYEVYTGQLTEGKEPAGYTKGDKLTTDHKLATGDLEANKYYKLVQFDGKDFVLSKTVGTDKGVAEVTLPDGTYRVVEDKANSTYKGEKGETLTGAKAVPFDLVLPAGLPDGTGNYSEGKPLNVYPKNVEKPIKFDKNFAKKDGLTAISDPKTLKDVGAVMDNYAEEKANAKAQIGKEIPYEAKAELPKGSVFTDLDLADSMDKGLKYNAEKKVTITVDPVLDKALVENTDYTVETVGNGFKVHFNKSGLDKLNKAAEKNDLSITFTYYANVTADAVVDKPMDNHATFTYNHTPPAPSSDKVKPKNNEIKVEKTWAKQPAPTDIKVKYVLLDANDKPVADVTFKSAKVVDETDLGNGITFEVDNNKNYSGTFKGLEADKEYKVKEIVDGYEPGYTVNNTNGTVTVKNTKTPTSITPTPPQVTVGGKKFVKTDKGGKNRLAGAEFVIQNKNDGTDKDKYLKITSTNSTAYDTAETNYKNAIEAVNKALAKGEISETNKVNIGGTDYKTKDEAMNKINGLQKTRDDEFVKVNLAYTWVANKEDATKFYSNGNGQFEVKGLEYGNYRAVETKAPAGYALPSDGGNFTFEVGKDSYTKSGDIDYVANSNKNDAMKIKNNKVSIPQTGGMGTVLFTVVGISLMAGAVIAMKKNREEA